MPAPTERHALAVHVAGIDPEGPGADRLYEAGCDDATIVVRDGVMHLDFEGEAPSFADAAVSAMHAIGKAGGRVLRVARIED